MKMAFDDNMKIDRGSWRRLMGVSEDHMKRAESDEKMRAALERLEIQMEEAEGLLFDAADPAFTYKMLDAGQLAVRGTSLKKHLDGCDRMVVMAVTLGHAVDRLISETQASKIALGVVIDSGASVMAERAANMAEEQIRAELAEAQTRPKRTTDAVADANAAGNQTAPLFMTPRFSPGYGDSPLEMQEQVLDLLDAKDQLGITLSKGYMMSPSKSITAIIGLADHPVTGRLATCDESVLKDKCQIRKEGKLCGQRK